MARVLVHWHVSDPTYQWCQHQHSILVQCFLNAQLHYMTPILVVHTLLNSCCQLIDNGWQLTAIKRFDQTLYHSAWVFVEAQLNYSALHHGEQLCLLHWTAYLYDFLYDVIAKYVLHQVNSCWFNFFKYTVVVTIHYFVLYESRPSLIFGSLYEMTFQVWQLYIFTSLDPLFKLFKEWWLGNRLLLLGLWLDRVKWVSWLTLSMFELRVCLTLYVGIPLFHWVTGSFEHVPVAVHVIHDRLWRYSSVIPCVELLESLWLHRSRVPSVWLTLWDQWLESSLRLIVGGRCTVWVTLWFARYKCFEAFRYWTFTLMSRWKFLDFWCRSKWVSFTGLVFNFTLWSWNEVIFIFKGRLFVKGSGVVFFIAWFVRRTKWVTPVIVRSL